MHEEGHMSLRRTLVAVAAGAAMLLAGCASVTTGTGSVQTSASSPSPSSSSAAPATGSPSTSEAPVPECSPGIDYCDGFSSASTGWPVENTGHYYTKYDDYLGGTYRMGERTANAKIALAPVDIDDDLEELRGAGRRGRRPRQGGAVRIVHRRRVLGPRHVDRQRRRIPLLRHGRFRGRDAAARHRQHATDARPQPGRQLREALSGDEPPDRHLSAADGQRRRRGATCHWR